MAKDTKQTTKSNRRTQVKELPKGEKELSKAEQKKVKGGPDAVIFLPNIGRGGGGNA